MKGMMAAGKPIQYIADKAVLEGITKPLKNSRIDIFCSEAVDGICCTFEPQECNA